MILLIIQQLRPDYLEAAWGQLGTGGLKRLLEKGAWFHDCRHAASSFPSTTLATLATGTWPAQHGIVADSWYDRLVRKPVFASEEALLATTLGAQVAALQNARAYVISLNPMQGWLFAGTPNAFVYWMDDRGLFITRGTMPDWLTAFNATVPIKDYHDAAWLAVGARSGAPPLRILNFDPAHPEQFLELYKASPFGQSSQFDLLSEMIPREGLGQRDKFDFVTVLAGASELLGYEEGGRSPLMAQMILQLDRRIEALLTQLNSVVGENAYDVVLAGAHGAPVEPATPTRVRMAVNGETIAEAVEKALSAAYAGHLRKYLYPFLYIDPAPDRDPEDVRKLAVKAAFELSAVAGYYTAGAACSTHDEFARRFANSFHLKRSGDVMLSYQADYVEDFGQGRGISYGSLYDYDIRVPLCFYGPQFNSGSFEAPVESVDLAPTLARAMGVAEPSSSVGRVLGEAFHT